MSQNAPRQRLEDIPTLRPKVLADEEESLSSEEAHKDTKPTTKSEWRKSSPPQPPPPHCPLEPFRSDVCI